MDLLCVRTIINRIAFLVRARKGGAYKTLRGATQGVGIERRLYLQHRASILLCSSSLGLPNLSVPWQRGNCCVPAQCEQ